MDIDETFVGEVVDSEIRRIIPMWFKDQRDLDLLTEALEEGGLEDTLIEITDLFEDKLRHSLGALIDRAFSGERIRTIGEEDIGDRTLRLLKTELSLLKERKEEEYLYAQSSLRAAKKRVAALEKELKRINK